jgi:hypothetical protein
MHFDSNLVVRGSKSTAHVLVIQDLNFKAEKLFHVFNYHHQKWQFDCQHMPTISWTCNIASVDIYTHDFQHT